MILHSTGNGVWTSQPNPANGFELMSVWGSGPNDVYVAGDGAGLSMLLHSTGDGTWTVVKGLVG